MNLASAIIIPATIASLVLPNYQKIRPQVLNSTKSIIADMQDSSNTQEFRSLSSEERNERVASWIVTLAKDLYEQIKKFKQEGNKPEALKIIKFLEQISLGVRDEQAVRILEELRMEVDTMSYSEIIHNDSNEVKIQNINGKKYLTATIISPILDSAKKEAYMLIEYYISSRRVRIVGTKVKLKLSKFNGNTIATTYIEIFD